MFGVGVFSVLVVFGCRLYDRQIIAFVIGAAPVDLDLAAGRCSVRCFETDTYRYNLNGQSCKDDIGLCRNITQFVKARRIRDR